MAERRMFSKSIVDSDAFLDMPLSTQLLYFHLSMRADDDGFINNAKSIMRNVRCNEDDIMLLIAKKFLIPFDSGVVVIKHWRIHNYIAKDRYKETKYKEEKSQLSLDENNSYTTCIQPVYELETQDRLGKDRTGKDSIEKDNIAACEASEPSQKEKAVKHKYGEYKNVRLTDAEYEKLACEYGSTLRDKAITFLDEYIEEKGNKYKSHYMTIRRWVISAVKEKEQRVSRESTNVFLDMLMEEGEV